MRWDLRAAIRLEERAASLLRKDDPRRLQLLFELGRNLDQARESVREEAVLSEAIEAAAAVGDAGTEAQALLASLHLELKRNPEDVTVRAAEGSRRAIRTFEELGDERGLAQAWQLLSDVYENRWESSAEQEALGRALTHARNAGDKKQEAQLRIGYAVRLLRGSAPLAEVSRYQQENLEWARTHGSPRVEAASLVLGGRLLAMRGEFDQARALIARGRALFDELGITVALLAVSTWSGEVEELAGDLAAAERDFRVGMEISERIGDTRAHQEFTFEVARLADLQGRYDEADQLTSIYEQDATSDDRWLRLWRRCRHARVMARRGEADDAARLAQEAVALAPPPDAALGRSHVLMDAADILSLAGHLDQAAPIVEEALQLYERKGSLVAAGKARVLLAELREAVASEP
jgi:tetratricopeptide (TPR) repeat protein